MFLKIIGTFEFKNISSETTEGQEITTSTTTITTSDSNPNPTIEQTPSIYTLSVSSPTDQIFEYFPGKEELYEVREELLETKEGEVLDIKFTHSENELGSLQIPVEDLYIKDKWTLTTSNSTLSIGITIVERVPKNWIDKGLEILSSPRPWYFKAEDIYSLIKHILDEYKVSSSYPVVEFCRLVDYASLTVGKNLLSLRLDEGLLLFLF